MSKLLSQNLPRIIAGIREEQWHLPKFVNGHWRKPKISGRYLNLYRKQAATEGVEWPLETEAGKSKMSVLSSTVPTSVPIAINEDKLAKMRPNKGHKRQFLREKRQVIIAEQMKKMPEMIAEYRRAKKEKRTFQDFWDKIGL